MQGLGQGNIGLSHKQEITPGPPFAPTAANDGLSVHGGTGAIVLGSNLGSPIPGMLLDNRQIEMAGKRFIWTDGGNPIFDLNPAIGLITLGERIGVIVQDGWEIQAGNQITGFVGAGLYAIFGPSVTQIGDLSTVGNGAIINITESGQPQFLMQSFPGTPALYFFIDVATGAYQFGDINSITNGNQLFINDAASNFQFKTVSARMMDLQFGSMVVQFGDIDAFGSGLTETLNGTNTHDVSNAASNALYSINGNPGVSGMITAANVATVEGGIITAIV